MNTEKGFAAGASEAAPAAPYRADNFEVIVVFTDVRETLRALKTAGQLANELGARIRILAPHIVPYPFPLEDRFLKPHSLERCFRTIIGEAKIDTRIDIRLCRGRWQMLKHGLISGSVVVMGECRCRCATSENALARKLRAAGHHMVLAPEEDS
jgi:hypothetical protein